MPQKELISTSQILKTIAAVITREVAEQIYSGSKPFTNLKTFFTDHSQLAERAYWACYNRARPDYQAGRLKAEIDSLYPDLREEYGISLTEAIRKPLPSSSDIQQLLRAWFYAGEDLSRDGLCRLGNDGYRVRHQLRVHPLPGETGSKKRPYAEKVCAYLGLGPELKPGHIVNQGQEPIKNVSLIAERELLFMLSILQAYDHDLRTQEDDFRKLFPQGIDQVLLDERDRHLAKGSLAKIADGRVISGGLEILLEIKTHKVITGRLITEIIGKYRKAQQWNDGAPVDSKIIVLNSNYNGLPDHKKRLEEAGWQVVTGEQFSRAYHLALGLLSEKEADFFSTAAVPIDANLLRTVHELTYQKSHLLLRQGYKASRLWISQMLHENTKALHSGKRVYNRTKYSSTTITPFSQFASLYGDRIRHLAMEDCLVVDLETAGFRNSGQPIVVLGMAYCDGSEMVTDLTLVRTPFEEKSALEKCMGHMSEKRLITFNGKTFDCGYLRERGLTHLIREKLPLDHIDMMEIYRRHAKRQGYPQHRLQTYERMEFGFRRSELPVPEIPASRIPESYWRFILGKDENDIPRILYHNQLDLITTAIMYDQLVLRKIKRR